MRTVPVLTGAEAAQLIADSAVITVSLLVRTWLSRRRTGGDRAALRRDRFSGKPDHPAPDRRRRHVRHQRH